MTISKNQLIFIKRVFDLNTMEMAKFLGVAPITVTRWESGKNIPVGIHTDILSQFYCIALEIDLDKNEFKANRYKSLMKLGVGAFIVIADFSINSGPLKFSMEPFRTT